MAAGRRVLDAGCGTGYGSARLAQDALSVTALDIAPDAILYAREHYGASGVQYLEGSCCAMPVADAAFDLVVSFEVIEHLTAWQTFLTECRRVLAPGGLLVVSTPNRDTYTEARRLSGPNPFHTHEFAFEEFASALQALFPQVDLYLQNHVEGIGFQPASPNGRNQPELQQAGLSGDPREAHFFLAVCSSSPYPPPPPLVYVPTTANVLRERERHIGKLEIDVNGLREEKRKLVEMFRAQEASLQEANRWSRNLDVQLAGASARIDELQAELESRTLWARGLDQQLAAAAARVASLQAELEDRNRWARDLDRQLAAATARTVELQAEFQQMAAGYEGKVAELLDAGSRAKAEWTLRSAELEQAAAGVRSGVEDLRAGICAQTTWGQQLRADIDESQRKAQELARAVADAKAKVAELDAENEAKTAWARRLEAELDAKGNDLVQCVEVLHTTERALDERTAQLNRFTASRWVKLGNRLGIGPKLTGG